MMLGIVRRIINSFRCILDCYIVVALLKLLALVLFLVLEPLNELSNSSKLKSKST